MARSRAAIAGAAGALAALLSSCGADLTTPSSGASLRLTAEVAPPTVTSETPATVVFRLQNVGGQPVALNFPSSCHMTPFIVESATGRIVYPEGGSWACATIVTSLQLPPNSVNVDSILVRAQTSAPSSPGTVSLAAGSYFTYVTLNADEIQLRSSPVAFTVE